LLTFFSSQYNNQATGWVTGVQFPAGILYLCHVQTSFGAHPASNQMGTDAPFSRGKVVEA